MRAPPKSPSKPPPFSGQVPNPRRPELVAAPRMELGDLLGRFPTLPSAPKIRTAPRPRPRPPPGPPARRLPPGPKRKS